MSDDEQALRDRLEAITAPPSRLEVGGLVEAGRRRTFRRRSWQAAGGVALATGVLVAVPTMVIGARDKPTPTPDTYVAASTPAEAASTKCRGKALRVPAGAKEAAAAGVDPTGRYVIGNSLVGQDFRPILWTDGVPKVLPLQAPSMQLNTVNASGVAAGLAEGDGFDYVFRYENGKNTRLRTPPGDWHVYPYPKMNAAGDIVINAEPQGNTGGKDGIALLWKAGTTTAVKLPFPDNANVYDITDDGLIVGGTYPGGSAEEAYVWDRNDKGHKLKAPAGMRASAYAAEGDWAVGGLWPAEGDGMAARWNLRTGELTKLGGDGPADSVNIDGWVVASGGVLRDGKKLTLPVPKGQAGSAVGVSDTGLVVGHAQNPDTNKTVGPYVWQC